MSIHPNGARDALDLGWIKMEWDPLIFDWLIKNDTRVLTIDGKLVVPPWINTAMQEYNRCERYADLDVGEYLDRLFKGLPHVA